MTLEEQINMEAARTLEEVAKDGRKALDCIISDLTTDRLQERKGNSQKRRKKGGRDGN